MTDILAVKMKIKRILGRFFILLFCEGFIFLLSAVMAVGCRVYFKCALIAVHFAAFVSLGLVVLLCFGIRLSTDKES